MQTLTLNTLFEQLLCHRDQTADFSTLGPWLQQQVASCILPELDHIAFASAGYTRNRIAKEEVDVSNYNFEALILRWDQQAQTPIHGHPAFSFYYVISGAFQMELFNYTLEAGLQLKERQVFYPTGSTWFLGQIGRYDNFIHRVKCLEPGHTFHIYSEDAQKGLSLQAPSRVQAAPFDVYCA